MRPTCLLMICNGIWVGPGLYGHNKFGLALVISAANANGWERVDPNPHSWLTGIKIRKTERFKEGK